MHHEQASHDQVPPPPPQESKDTKAPGTRQRAGVLQDLVVRARPVRFLPVWSRYSLTTLIVFCCFSLRYFLEGIYPYPFLLFLPSVILAAFLFDRGTGFFAAILSAILASYFFIQPHFSFAPEDIGQLLSIIVFLIVGLFTAAAIEALRVTVDELGEKNNDLQNSETRYKAILDTAVDAVIIINEKAIIHSFNPAAERIFGYSSDEVIGKNVKILMPAPEARAHDGYVNRYLNTGEKKIIGSGREVTGMCKDGLLIPLDLAIAEWFDASGKRYFTGIMRDISARKRNEAALLKAQEELKVANEKLQMLVDQKSEQVIRVETKLFQAQKLEAVGRAVSVLAHDFKNFLSPIIVAMDLAKRATAENDNRMILLDMAAKSADDGKNMIDDVLAFVHKNDPVPEHVPVNEFIREKEEILRQSINHGVTIQFRLDPSSVTIFVDPLALQRALLNLVTNARDAMSEGGLITIETATENLQGTEGGGSDRAQPGKYVRLTVRDTGNGMTPDVLEKIFEPFYTTKPIGKGTGLGLSMVMDFVHFSNGRITIRSSPGLGTSVNLYFPLIRYQAA